LIGEVFLKSSESGARADHFPAGGLVLVAGYREVFALEMGESSPAWDSANPGTTECARGTSESGRRPAAPAEIAMPILYARMAV
jgi:hypothetical protein